MHACVRACVLQPDLFTARAVHPVDVSHHRISGETWQQSVRRCLRRTAKLFTSAKTGRCLGLNTDFNICQITLCMFCTGAIFNRTGTNTEERSADLWQHRLMTGLPPPPLPPWSSVLQGSVGQLPALKQNRVGLKH